MGQVREKGEAVSGVSLASPPSDLASTPHKSHGTTGGLLTVAASSDLDIVPKFIARIS